MDRCRPPHLWHSEARNRQNETQPWPPLHSRSETQNIGDEYGVFPPKPKAEYDILRHSWVFGRRKKPHVPVLQGAKLPSATTSPNDSARSFSLFFRPWIFGIQKVPGNAKGNENSTGATNIPHIAMSDASKPATLNRLLYRRVPQPLCNVCTS